MNKLAFVLITAGALCLAGCNVFDDSLLPSGNNNPEGGVGGCGKTVVPPPESEPPDAGEGPGLVVYALKDVLLEQGGDAASIGYNLDGLCTQSPEDPSECVPMGAVILDGPMGVDNQFGQKFYGLLDIGLQSSKLPALDVYPKDSMGKRLPFQTVARDAQDKGQGTLLVLVKDWNGTMNDSRMSVTIAQAAGGTTCDQKDAVHFEGYDLVKMDGTPADPPVWDGSKENCWWIRDDTYVNGNPSNPAKIFDDSAYANDGQTVIHLPDRQDIYFFAGPVGADVRLTDAVATATMVNDGESLTDLVVAGRWAVTDLTSTGRNVGVCPGSFLNDTLTSQANMLADVRSQPEHRETDLPCNALSMGVRFERGVKGTLMTNSSGVPIAKPSRPLPDPCEGVSADGGVPDGGMSDGG